MKVESGFARRKGDKDVKKDFKKTRVLILDFTEIFFIEKIK
jgi:hypothetical protein